METARCCASCWQCCASCWQCCAGQASTPDSPSARLVPISTPSSHPDPVPDPPSPASPPDITALPGSSASPPGSTVPPDSSASPPGSTVPPDSSASPPGSTVPPDSSASLPGSTIPPDSSASPPGSTVPPDSSASLPGSTVPPDSSASLPGSTVPPDSSASPPGSTVPPDSSASPPGSTVPPDSSASLPGSTIPPDSSASPPGSTVPPDSSASLPGSTVPPDSSASLPGSTVPPDSSASPPGSTVPPDSSVSPPDSSASPPGSTVPPDSSASPPGSTVPPDSSASPPGSTVPPDSSASLPGSTVPPDSSASPPGSTVPPDSSASPPGSTVPPDSSASLPGSTVPPDSSASLPGSTVPPDSSASPPGSTVPPDSSVSPPDSSASPPGSTVPPDSSASPPGSTVPPDSSASPPGSTVPPDSSASPPGSTVPPDSSVSPPGSTVPPDSSTSPPGSTVPPDSSTSPPGSTLPPDSSASPPGSTAPPDSSASPPGSTVPPDSTVPPGGTASLPARHIIITKPARPSTQTSQPKRTQNPALVENKKKPNDSHRMTSKAQSDLLLNIFPDVILDAGEATLGEKQRDTMKDKAKKEKQREAITRAVCALLNSGGGIVLVRSDDPDYQYMKHGLGMDIENELSQLVLSIAKSHYCDFLQHGSCLLIFIKTWIVQDKHPRLCSLQTGLYSRSFTSKKTLELAEVGNLLEEKIKGWASSPLHNKPLVFQYIEDKLESENNSLSVGDDFDVGESEFVEYKSFMSKKLKDRIKESIKQYVSAFANSRGGYFIIGVQDDTLKVTGCDPQFTEEELERAINKDLSALRTVHLDNCSSDRSSSIRNLCKVSFKSVKGINGENKGFVIFLKIEPFCCLIFAMEPQSWILDPNIERLTASERDPNLDIKALSASEWTKMMTSSTELTLEELHERLTPSEQPPQAKPVYSKKGLETLEQQQANLFGSLDGGATIRPEGLYSILKEEHPELEGLLQPLISGAAGIVIVSRSWAVDLEFPRNPDVVCDALVLIPGEHPKLYSVFKGDISKEAFAYSRRTALVLRQKLVNMGSYTGKLCVIPAALRLNSTNESAQFPWPDIIYPETYRMPDVNTINKLLRSLAIVLLHFRSFLSDKVGIEYFNLLTTEQYKILSETLLKGPYFVCGPPGTGKTVLAVKMIMKIKNTYNCSPDEILYICKTIPLRDFVRRQVTCEVGTLLDFLYGEHSNIKHIVVDEAQTFERKYGDWFTKAKEMVGETRSLYIFLDPFQSGQTTYEGLLPPVQEYNHKILYNIIRSPKGIFAHIPDLMKGTITQAERINDFVVQQYRSPEMERNLRKTEVSFLRGIVDGCKCAHDVAGLWDLKEGIQSLPELVEFLWESCKKYLSEGYAPGDIAILFVTSKRADMSLLKQEMEEQTKEEYFVTAAHFSEDRIVVDNVHEFAGLERKIVFAIVHVWADPGNSNEPLLCAASRATAKLHVIDFI
ncbi:schlafen family member 13-like [Hyperolius riggenbachi]|uniref:schlafen family member 13-like n=1 Tax=Hyperolius riggenbachi TaxID=752182 RepID=UPI0035A3B0E7